MIRKSKRCTVRSKKYLIDYNNCPILRGTHRTTLEVDGWPVKFKGFGRYEWFVCRLPQGEWSVSEVSTGMRVGDMHLTKQRAIKEAEKHLRRHGPKLVYATVEKELRRRDPYKTSGVVAARRKAKAA